MYTIIAAINIDAHTVTSGSHGGHYVDTIQRVDTIGITVHVYMYNRYKAIRSNYLY